MAEALKDDKFKKLLFDYMDELRDPKNKEVRYSSQLDS